MCSSDLRADAEQHDQCQNQGDVVFHVQTACKRFVGEFSASGCEGAADAALKQAESAWRFALCAKKAADYGIRRRQPHVQTPRRAMAAWMLKPARDDRRRPCLNGRAYWSGQMKFEHLPSPALPRTPPSLAGEGLGERGCQDLFVPDQ